MASATTSPNGPPPRNRLNPSATTISRTNATVTRNQERRRFLAISSYKVLDLREVSGGSGPPRPRVSAVVG
jgi:hypothetical protein